MVHDKLEGVKIDRLPVKRVLASCYNKDGLIDFAKAVGEYGAVFYSTGGTAKKLKEAGLQVIDIADYTGSPEILNGRVKSLHPKVHGGLLAVYGNEGHDKDMETQGIVPFDMVICSLYPFDEAVAKGADMDTSIENIDIGGPCMIRAGAKNHRRVAVVTSPTQYTRVLKELSSSQGHTSYSFRRSLASSAFALTASYEASITKYMTMEVSRLKGAVPAAEE